MQFMDSFNSNRRKYFESLGASARRLIPSIEKPPILEEKQLPTHLKYAYLGGGGGASTLPDIISSSLFNMEEEKLSKAFKEHEEAIG